MIERLRDLGLDAELCQRQTTVLAGLGTAYMSELERRSAVKDPELVALAAATNFRRAGANALLIDRTDDARVYFRQAVLAYATAESPYARFIENLAAPDHVILRTPSEIDDPRDVFLLWIAGEDRDTARVRERAESHRTKRIGVLGIELGTYLDLFDAQSEGASDERLSETLLPIAAAYAMGLKQARRDRHHWTRLTTAFHPAEPDVLALLVALDKRLARRQRAVAPLMQTMPLGEDSVSLLRGTLSQFGAWRDGRREQL